MSIARNRYAIPTQAAADAIVRELDSGVKRSVACAIVGIDYRAFVKWIDRGNKVRHRMFETGEDFSELPDGDRECAELAHRVAVVEGCIQRDMISQIRCSGDWRAAAAYMESRFGRGHSLDGSEDEEAQREEAQRSLAERLAQLAGSIDEAEGKVH